MGSGHLGRGEEQLSRTFCRGSQLNLTPGREGTLLSLPVGPELTKCASKGNTKTPPAAGTNLLLVLLNMVVNKELVVNGEVSSSSIPSPSRETTVTHPPSLPQGK